MKKYILHITMVATLLFLPLFSYAQGYKVTPLIIDKDVLQRDIFSETITITNNNTHKVNVYASVNEVVLDEGGDIAEFVPPSMSDNTDTVTSWISITRGRIEVGPGQTKEIPISFKIHPQAKAGVYHALIGFGTGNNRPTAEQQVKNGTAPRVIVSLSVDQDQNEFLKLSHFIIDKFVTTPDNSAVTYTLSNPGTATLVPTGEVIIYDGRGEEVGAIVVNPDKEPLAPGQETTYSVAAPVDGLLGKYKAFLSVDYGSAQIASVYDTTFFYVLPWQKILILFAVLMSIAIILTVVVHRRIGNSDGYDDGSEEVPLFIRDTVSEEREHDINLK